jgi:PE family
MSFVVAVPEVLGTAATDLSNIGSTLSAAHTAAAASTRNTADNTALHQTHLNSRLRQSTRLSVVDYCRPPRRFG